MKSVRGSDGREWALERDWPLWKPRWRGWDSHGDGGGLDLFDGGDDFIVFALVAVAFVLLLVLAGPIIGIAILAAELVLVLVLFPLALLWRVLARRPWHLVARSGNETYDAVGRTWRDATRKLREAEASLSTTGHLPPTWSRSITR